MGFLGVRYNKVKVLLLYTSHKQLEEVRLSSYFYNRNDYLRQMDVLLHCNNKLIDKEKLKKALDLFQAPKKDLIFSEKNSGHHSGVAEAVDSVYHKLKEYDFVIHLHPDIFLVHTEKLESTLRENFSKDIDYIVWDLPARAPGEPASFARDSEYASDFFIFKPKKNNNIFKHYIEYWGEYPHSGCERFLFCAIQKDGLKTARLDRDPWAAMTPPATQTKGPEQFGIWHCHHLPHARAYIEGQQVSK